ncbi:MAG: DUF2141 domain-containing protein, partial [Alphaproteobacteria bacterium]
HASWAGDLYVVLGDPLENGAFSVRIYFNPLVRLIWIGAVIMFAGGGLSLSDRRLRVGAPGPAMRLSVAGFKDNQGILRVQLYSDKPEEYLEKGKKLKRIEVPVPDDATATAQVCMAVPAPGEYAIIVMHDRNGDGKASPFSDGFGLPGGEKMKLRKPKYEEGRVTVGKEVVDIAIDLQYLTGNNTPRRAR